MDFILVGTGGFIGAITRFGIHTLEKQWSSFNFPFGTLIINVLGCFLAGLLVSVMEQKFPSSRQLYLFLMAGFLSSFTTFSTFSSESFNLFRNGEALSAGLNILMNLIFGLVAIWVGRSLLTS